MIDPERVKEKIADTIDNARVDVLDMTGDGDHFRVVVVAEAFEGKPMVKQHQLVYDALGDSMEGDIHALGLKTYTPEEWENLQESSS
jgi:acid stress-induced BolA-like protein IbaG/YrbA